jgi:hypothetical protein
MIVQVDKLFINTDTITTISAFERAAEKSIEYGFTVNGINYILLVVPSTETEKCKEASVLCNNVVSTIISKMVFPVQKLSLKETEETDD